MASQGRGNWPFFSVWFSLNLGSARAVPWNLQTAAADGPDQLIWSDWFFEASQGGPTIVEADYSSSGAGVDSGLSVLINLTQYSSEGIGSGSITISALNVAQYSSAGSVTAGYNSGIVIPSVHSSSGIAEFSANSISIFNGLYGVQGTGLQEYVSGAIYNVSYTSSSVSGGAIESSSISLTQYLSDGQGGGEAQSSIILLSEYNEGSGAIILYYSVMIDDAAGMAEGTSVLNGLAFSKRKGYGKQFINFGKMGL